MVKNAEETYSAKEKDLNKSNIEPVDANLRQQELQNQTLNIKNLCKIYPNGKKAVNDLSLTMYKGQIFSLLGFFSSIYFILTFVTKDIMALVRLQRSPY